MGMGPVFTGMNSPWTSTSATSSASGAATASSAADWRSPLCQSIAATTRAVAVPTKKVNGPSKAATQATNVRRRLVPTAVTLDVTSHALREITMSRSCLRMRCTQSTISFASLAGTTAKVWPNLFL